MGVRPTALAAVFAAAGVDPFADALDILYPEHIPGMLAAVAGSGSSRCRLGWHGMSIIAGVGSTDSTVTSWASAWRTSSVAPKVGETIAAHFGGTQSLGMEVCATSSSGNQFFTKGGGLALTSAYSSVGPGGQFYSLSGAAAHTLAWTITGTAGQVCRVYAYVSGGSGIVTPRYSISGDNTVATTDLPTGTGTDVTPVGSSWWYIADIVLTNAGTSTVTLYSSVTSGHNFNVYAVDPDYRTDAGIVVHRIGYSGKGLGDHLAKALDNTDTQPSTGSWIGAGNAARRQTVFNSITSQFGLDGILVSFDVNDIQHWNSYAWGLSRLTTHINNVVAAYAAASAEVLFVLGLSLRDPSNYSGSPAFTQADVIDAYKTAAAASSNVAVLDLRDHWAGATLADQYASQVADTSKWLGSEAPNYLHPSAAGHLLFAQLVGNAILKAAT